MLIELLIDRLLLLFVITSYAILAIIFEDDVVTLTLAVFIGCLIMLVV
jgi:hypothetical protein